jgi:hypothetical protein
MNDSGEAPAPKIFWGAGASPESFISLAGASRPFTQAASAVSCNLSCIEKLVGNSQGSPLLPPSGTGTN